METNPLFLVVVNPTRDKEFHRWLLSDVLVDKVAVMRAHQNDIPAPDRHCR